MEKFGDAELEDVDIAVVQSGIDEELTTKYQALVHNIKRSDVQVSLP